MSGNTYGIYVGGTSVEAAEVMKKLVGSILSANCSDYVKSQALDIVKNASTTGCGNNFSNICVNVTEGQREFVNPTMEEEEDE